MSNQLGEIRAAAEGRTGSWVHPVCVDRGAVVHGAVCADGVEVLEADTQRIEQIVATGAPGIRAMASSCARAVIPAVVGATKVVFALAGGGGVAEHKMRSSIHLPRWTGPVTSGCELLIKKLAWVSTPERGVPARLTFTSEVPVGAPVVSP